MWQYLRTLVPTLSRDHVVVVGLSGRGDKDVQHVSRIVQSSIDASSRPADATPRIRQSKFAGTPADKAQGGPP